MPEPGVMASQEETVTVFLAPDRRIAGVIIALKEHGGSINF